MIASTGLFGGWINNQRDIAVLKAWKEEKTAMINDLAGAPTQIEMLEKRVEEIHRQLSKLAMLDAVLAKLEVIEKNMVPRGEVEAVWQAQAQRFAALERDRS